MSRLFGCLCRAVQLAFELGRERNPSILAHERRSKLSKAKTDAASKAGEYNHWATEADKHIDHKVLYGYIFGARERGEGSVTCIFGYAFSSGNPVECGSAGVKMETMGCTSSCNDIEYCRCTHSCNTVSPTAQGPGLREGGLLLFWAAGGAGGLLFCSIMFVAYCCG